MSKWKPKWKLRKLQSDKKKRDLTHLPCPCAAEEGLVAPPLLRREPILRTVDGGQMAVVARLQAVVQAVFLAEDRTGLLGTTEAALSSAEGKKGGNKERGKFFM